MSSCWCLCGGDSGVGVAAGSFSIAVDESAPEDQSSYRRYTLTSNREAWCGLNVLDTLGRGRGRRRRCFSFDGRGLNLLHGGCGIDEGQRAGTRSGFRRQSALSQLAQLLHRLHVSLYNFHTAFPSIYRAAGLMNRHLDLCFSPVF